VKCGGEVRVSQSKGGEDVGVDAVAAMSLPIAGSAPSLIGLGYVGEESGGSDELRTKCSGPHLLYMALCDGGPPTRVRLGAPDQGAI
jgi:hypothetical protein